MAQKNNVKDEVMEKVWMKKEEGSVRKEDLLKSNDPRISHELLEGMIRDDYLFDVKGEINLTDKGYGIAFKIIRSHRLAERLFVDILEIGDEFLEPNACTLEHVLSQEITTAICTLLGHPRECPHGRPIPQGECCKKVVKAVGRVVMPLSELRAGESSKIVYVATKNHSRLDMLTTLGISPGTTVKVHQTFPSFVIKVAETDVALDTDILKSVYVRRSEET